MRPPESPAGRMKLVGGDVCLDFVNTVSGRRRSEGGADEVVADKLSGYPDLVAFALHARVLPEAEASSLLRAARRRRGEAEKALGRAVAWREALYRVLLSLARAEVPSGPDLENVNAALVAERSRERLVPGPLGLRWESKREPPSLDDVLAPVRRAAAALLTSGDVSRLRRCAGEECGWLFLDRSRNRSRQWCQMEDCGNRSKVRRFRARSRGA